MKLKEREKNFLLNLLNWVDDNRTHELDEKRIKSLYDVINDYEVLNVYELLSLIKYIRHGR